MKHVPALIRVDETGWHYHAPRLGNEDRAKRRRTLTARLSDPHTFVAPSTLFRGKPMTHALECARRLKQR